MSFDSTLFLKKTLGEDFFESLCKVELWKPGTRTTIDHEEIKTALQIVPRTIMALMIKELTSMNIGDNKELVLPLTQNGLQNKLYVNKFENDVFSGYITSDNKNIVDFKNRSIPGVGLVIMSALELYDLDELEEKPEVEKDLNVDIQKIIEDRLSLHELINKVVDRKIEERDAIKQLVLAKLTNELNKKPEIEENKEIEISPIILDKKEKKELPLKIFLDQVKNKKQKHPEFKVQMEKNEHVNCPDCGKDIFDGEMFSGCICYGDDRDRKVHIKKTEDGIKVRFGKGWDVENIEMLLSVLRSNRG